MHKVSARPNSTTNSGAARSESSHVVDDPIRQCRDENNRQMVARQSASHVTNWS